MKKKGKKMKKIIVICAGLFLITKLLFAQSTDWDRAKCAGGNFSDDAYSITNNFNEWINMNPDSTPSGRYYYGMATDLAEHKVVLFGGLGQVGGNYCSLDETWIYDPVANSWKNPNPVIHPPKRYGHSMTYSSKDSLIVLFGGGDPYSIKDIVYNDVWLYSVSDNQWEEVNITSPLPARAFNSIAYDNNNNKIVIFGGYNYLTTQWFNDTWIYTIGDSVFINQNPSNSPGYRNSARMVYSDPDSVFILFGGWYPSNQLNETWIYNLNNNTWTQMYPNSSPPPRMAFGMTYDKINKTVIIFGGGRLPPLFDDTWTYKFEINEWTNLYPTSSPSPRHRMQIAFVDSMAVLFGGYSTGGELNDTWIFLLPCPDISVNPDSLLYLTNEIVIDSFAVKNSGNSDLYITNIINSALWITLIEPGAFAVTPNDSVMVKVVVDGTTLLQGEYTDSLFIYSNDPDESELMMPVFLQVLTGVEEEIDYYYKDFFLSQNYPNPFSNSTVIGYQLQHSGKVVLIIYDINGQEVITLVNEKQPAGNYSVIWDGKNYLGNRVGTGIYYMKMKSGSSFSETKKILLVK